MIAEYYDVGGPLTEGAQTDILRGIRRLDERHFAIKVVEKSMSNGAEGQQLRVLMEIDHTGIIKLSDWFETEKTLYVVLEYATGGELFSRIQQQGAFSERDAAAAFRQLLEAVGHMHEKGIAHCNLKPENILYEDGTYNQLKIAGFSCAQFVPANKKLFVQFGAGTPSYVAPEILKAAGFDTKADMWSLGVILYVMLAGVLPFGSRNMPEMRRNVVAGHYSFPEAMFGQISAEAQNLISALLTVDPALRLSWTQASDHPWMTRQLEPQPAATQR